MLIDNNMSKSSKACMIATTPFQILGCISMVRQLKLDADLYIGDLFQNSAEVSQKLRDLHIFRNIILINERKIFDENVQSRVKKRLKQIPIYIKLDRTVESYLLEENYEQIYISNNTLICRLTYLYLFRKNSNIQIIYYDDGIGSYCNPKIMGISKIEQMYWILFVGPCTQRITFGARLYAPGLYLDIMKNFHNFTSIDLIEPLQRLPENDAIMQAVFSVTKGCEISQNVVVLDTIRDVEFDQLGMKRIASIYEYLNKRYREKLIFKQHPKDFTEHAGYSYFRQRQMPFEAISYFADLSEKILLTNMSTAAFTPKMLFGQEPVIISLYGIMKEHRQGTNNFEKLFQNFRELYTDPKRIHMPKTEAELIELLDHYLL